jgi:hypothetical protein
MTHDLIEEFRSVVNENYGIYLDSIMGFLLTLESFKEKQKKLAESSNRSIEDQDQIDFAHYSPPQERYLHTETQGEFKKRMSWGDKNHNYVGNSFIISIFSYWEDHYREKIAKSIGVDKIELKEPIMGDIRRFRNSIIHHRSIALQEIEKCEVMRIFKEGDLIKFTDKQILEIVDHINDYLDRFYTSD